MLFRSSGLPDNEQITTARDQARLAIAIQERFPRYYRYFSITNFTYRGETMRNHNKLLGRVAGVDGIKTGYTQASGFNLVTSVRRAGRHIVAVVLGGNSGSERDAQMRGLIERHILEASLKRPEVKVASTAGTAVPRNQPATEPRAEARAETGQVQRPAQRTIPRIVIVSVVPPPSETAAAIIPTPAAGSNDPINPTTVKTVPIRAATTPFVLPNLNAYAQSPELGSVPFESSPLRGPATEPQQMDALDVSPAAPTVTGNINVQPAANEPAREPVREATREPTSRPIKPVAAGNWAVQVGAFEIEAEAKQRLSIARSMAAELLGTADPYTERTTKGDKTLYRARFAGFDRARAEAVCKHLLNNYIACMALKN